MSLRMMTAVLGATFLFPTVAVAAEATSERLLAERLLQVPELKEDLAAAAQGFFVPAHVPRANYSIQAEVDAVHSEVRGRVTIRLVNSGTRALTELMIEADQMDLTAGIDGNGEAVTVVETRKESDGARTRVRLLKAVPAAGSLVLTVTFRRPFALDQAGKVALARWHPKVWWGVPVQDDYDVRLAVPADFAVGTSGRWIAASETWHAKGVRQFGLFLGRRMKTEVADAGGVQVRLIHSATSVQWADTLLKTAVDAIMFYRRRFGVYPYDALTIVPGMTNPAGGYPIATSLVAVHGMESYDKRPETFWRWITAHEIGHQYWYEHVMSRDYPNSIGWLLIGLGVYADREYSRARDIDGPHRDMLGRYVEGRRNGLDTTASRSEADIDALDWDFNNVVTHGKGFAIVSALAVTMGEPAFNRMYRRLLHEYGGKRLGVADFERVATEESGEDLTWFFEQWVRSNRFLAYEVKEKGCAPFAGEFECTIRVERTGTLEMPVPVTVIFEDGSSQMATTDRVPAISELKFRSKSALKEANLDPRGDLAQIVPLPKVTPSDVRRELQQLPWTGAGERARALYERALQLPPPPSPVDWLKLGLALYDGKFYEEAVRCFQHLAESLNDQQRFVGLAWQGQLLDLLQRRPEALEKYRAALALKVSPSMTHSQYGITLDREWVEARLQSAFARTDAK